MTCLCKPSKFPFEENLTIFWIFWVFLEQKCHLHKPSNFLFLESPSPSRSYDLLMSAITISFLGTPTWAGHMTC
jgi:hypothetical protein